MKKILAIALAVLMLAAMAVPAFAANQELVFTENAEENVLPERGNVVVTYGVAQSYLVTIPQDVAFSDTALKDERTLSVANLKLRGDEKLTIAIDSEYDYKLVDTNKKSVDVDYWIATSDYTEDAVGINTPTEKLADEAIALVVNRPDGNTGANQPTSGAVTLTFETLGTSQQGNYIDTLTFTVAIATGVAIGGNTSYNAGT